MSYQEVFTYKSASAYYHIKREANETIVAELQQYLGNEEHKPPRKVVYTKSETDYQPSLLEDMARAFPKGL